MSSLWDWLSTADGWWIALIVFGALLLLAFGLAVVRAKRRKAP